MYHAKMVKVKLSTIKREQRLPARLRAVTASANPD